MMQGRSAGRAGAAFGLAQMVAGRGGARARRAFVTRWCRCGWGALGLMTPLNSGLRLSFRQPWSIFFRNAELVNKEDGDDARTACPPRRVVGQRRWTGHNDEFADVFCLCRGWRGGHLSRCISVLPDYYATTPPTVGMGITAARRLLRPVIAAWWCGVF